ncbi:MAG: hypothetical protein ABSF09_03510 [Candidatus Bathyarchaeia archaeon]
MRMRSIASAVLFVIILANVPSAYAHEHRNVTIANQQVQFTVGWIVEPAYVDQQNSVDFRVALAASGSPVVGLEKILQVEVSTGSNQMVLSLEPVFRKPGAYGADVIPTVPGSYAFRFFGNVNGTSVNERFVCGPTTFDCVTDVAGIQFPEKTPSGRAVQLGFQGLQSQVPNFRMPSCWRM